MPGDEGYSGRSSSKRGSTRIRVEVACTVAIDGRDVGLVDGFPSINHPRPGYSVIRIVENSEPVDLPAEAVDVSHDRTVSGPQVAVVTVATERVEIMGLRSDQV
jgi:hypothetical protein